MATTDQLMKTTPEGAPGPEEARHGRPLLSGVTSGRVLATSKGSRLCSHGRGPALSPAIASLPAIALATAGATAGTSPTLPHGPIPCNRQVSQILTEGVC